MFVNYFKLFLKFTKYGFFVIHYYSIHILFTIQYWASMKKNWFSDSKLFILYIVVLMNFEQFENINNCFLNIIKTRNICNIVIYYIGSLY